MSRATLNVRIPDELKKHGMQVLDREGVSVSDLVRDLFRYLEENQELPEFSENSKGGLKKIDAETRREAMMGLIGTLPSDVDLEAAKLARLMRKTRPGVRA